MGRFLIVSSLFVVLDLYAFQAIRTLSSNPWLRLSFIVVNLLVTLLALYVFFIDRYLFSISVSNMISGLFILFLMSKLALVAFLLGEDVIRFLTGVYQKIAGSKEEFLPSRRKFLSRLALSIAAIPFSTLLYGMIKGKYNFKVLKYNLYFKDLPDAFDGFQLTHLSDLHSGSFDNAEKINYAIDLVNKQASDAIMLTGDMVNLKASELLPWKSTLGRLKAKDGVFSVLGNHDYGRYVKWNDANEEQKNMKQMLTLQKEMGFQVLMNEHCYIEKNNDRIAIVGMENWGVGSVQRGDIDKAINGINENDFKLILSHDPTHWEEKLLPSPTHCHLTLSGHTHGMQFGIEIPGWIKWSPAQWRYKHWAGIYEKDQQYINVNRGFGFVAFPGRTGMWPEISVITLKKA